jgi:hypothetical protein
MKTLLTGILLSGLAFASNDLAHRPRSFPITDGQAVFVDFKTAIYDISYDIPAKEARVVAHITFDAPEEGLPIFDSVQAPSSVILDGKSVNAIETKTPSNETTLRVVNSQVGVGPHTLRVEVPLKDLLNIGYGEVKSAFWTSDLSHRQFLERYIPASFEYDQVEMTFNVNFIGSKKKQVVYTNGVVTEKESGFSVSYPSYFNASSIFFHTIPQGVVEEIRYTLRSIDGREVPVVIYMAPSWGGNTAATLEKFKQEASKVFHELEADYGAWPHPSLIIYNAGSGGMEYCGATITDFRALGHELFHSYFARGVMPANGNSGWLDEALASWRDDGHQSSASLSGSSMMSSHPYYTRTTDRDAYTFGENFMRLMNHKTMSKGGLKPFMRYMIEKKTFAPLFVEEFIKEMEGFYGVNLEADFKRYTYGTTRPIEGSTHKQKHAHPMHQKMSVEELKKHL